jgi:hypothetical protein
MQDVQYGYLLNKYLKYSVWSLAVRYDIYIYIYIYVCVCVCVCVCVSLGGKVLSKSDCCRALRN